MTDRIEPALSAEEWQEWGDMLNPVAYYAGTGRPGAAIALLNDMLDDGDPQKLTDRHVAMLRDAARIAEEYGEPSGGRPTRSRRSSGILSAAGAGRGGLIVALARQNR